MPARKRPYLISVSFEERDVRVPSMRARLDDARLLRVAFAAVFAVAGAIGAVSVAILLRTWRIWDVSSTTVAVASVGSACLFGVLCFRMPRAQSAEAGVQLTPARRWALAIAVPVLLMTTGWALVLTTGVMRTSVLKGLTFASVLGSMVAAHGASAVILVEMIRSTMRRTSRWADRRHFALVGVVWALLSGTGAILLWRARQKFNWP